jgi:general secretion pathway protein D
MFFQSLPSRAISALACLAALTLSITAPAQTVRPGGASTRGGISGGGTRIGGTTRGTTVTGQRAYRSNTELGDAMIQIDPETRSVVIVTDEDTHRELEKVIETLDRPKPQVLIKVVFVEVTLNKDSDIGLEGNYTFNFGNKSTATSGSQTRTTSSTSIVNNTSTTNSSTVTTPITDTVLNSLTGGSDFGITSALAAGAGGPFVRAIGDNWSATLRALQTRGKVEVLSRPSIMARNNQEAVIVVGQEVPFVTNSQVTQLGQTINTIQYDNIGIILRVTPFITSSKSVEMIVAPEISSLSDRTVPISNNVSSPVIDKRSAETVVVTPHAETVVIGGLMQTQRTSSIQKVPILGDLPVIGFPFRRTIKSDVKKELLIFLTPYIVENPDALNALSKAEVGRTESLRQSFTPQEFDKFIDTPSLFPEGGQELERPPAARPKPVKATPVSAPAPPAPTTPRPARGPKVKTGGRQ